MDEIKRRRHPRREYPREGIVTRFIGDSEGQYKHSDLKVYDFSTSGLSIWSCNEFAVNEQIQLEMTLQDGPPLSLTATIKHVSEDGEGYRYGAEFKYDAVNNRAG